MNDHDLLIKLGTQVEYLIKEVQNLRDGTKKDILDLQVKVDTLEKTDISLRNDIQKASDISSERFISNSTKIKSMEDNFKEGVQKHESTKAYLWRKAFEWIMPFIFILAGLVLSKLGILNIN